MKFRGIAQGVLALALIWGAVSCGGGGGGGGGGSGSTPGLGGSGFGFFDNFGNTTAPPNANDFPKLWGVNLPVILYFNENIDPDSCSNLSIDVTTIDDPLGKAAYGAGHAAAVDYLVYGSQLWIKPRIFFSQTEVTFGYLPDAVYEIRFQLPPSPNVVRSVSGRPITIKSTGKPVAFRTPAKDDPDGYIYDEIPGPPEPVIFTLFDKQNKEIAHWIDGSWYQNGQPAAKVEVDPMEPPRVRIDFNEPVQPKTVVNFADKSSPSLSVYFNFNGQHWDPVKALGDWELTQRVKSDGSIEVFAEFTPELIALAPETEYFINVKGIIEDLAGNSKGYGVSDEVSFFTLASSDLLPDLVEEFDSTAYEDTSTTSAIWSWNIGGSENALIPGSGGGTGADGPFYPPDQVPPDAWVFPQAMKIGLPTDKSGQPREYNFTSFTLPEGWLLYPVDLSGSGYPLVIKATGSIKVVGTIDMSPDDGSENGADGSYGDYKFGTTGGKGIAGGGDGGQGGSVYNGMTSPFYDVAIYEKHHDNFGITGVSTALSDYALQDSQKTQADFQKIKDFFDQGYRLYLQPNVGMGPGNEVVVTNHPTFVVSGIDVANRVINIVSDPQSPDYRGSMLQASKNPGIPIPPIAKVNDPYLLGVLKGADGVDPAGMGREGKGSDPLSVAQTVATFASAGGAGGAGALDAGSDGETGPDYGPPGGAIGGFSTPDSLGAPGGASFGPSGIVLGPDPADPKHTLEVEDILGSADYTGYRVNPDSLEGGWLFTIASNDHNSITIEPVSSGIEIYDLSNINFNGDEEFQIFPPEDVGGAGGGGSGAELTGTLKTVFEQPYQLPGWICGAGGGAGGGVLKLETARDISVSSLGRVYAEGGDGGTITGIDVSIPGGGGGSGGCILMRARNEIKFSQDAVVSVLGGHGGGLKVMGGDGGAGFIRLENSAFNLKPSSFADTTYPPVTGLNLGVFPAQEGDSLALSKFYFMGISRPDFIYDPSNPDPDRRGLKVVYDMLEIDEFGVQTEYEKLVYPDPSGAFPDPPLFTITFNSCPADNDGFLDMGKITNDFVDYSDFDTMDGNPYVRFKVVLKSSEEIENGGVKYTYKNLKVRSVSFNRVQL